MRAFAVMLVLVAHAGLAHLVPGGSGVTIFFSISGFIITYLLLRERDKTGMFSASRFYLRRAIKIGPPFAVIIIIPTLIYSAWASIDWGAFLAQVLFVFNWRHLGGESAVLPGTGVVWSLSIEEQFYIVFAVVWLFAVRSRHWRTYTATAAAIAVIYSTVTRCIMALDPSLTDRIYYGSDTRLDGITWGVLAALGFHLWQEKGNRVGRIMRSAASDWTLIGAIVIFLTTLLIRDEWFRNTFRYSLQSLTACAVIVYGLLPGDGPLRKLFYAASQWRVVSTIGLASYSIYLVHLILINLVQHHVTLPLPVAVFALSALGVVVGIGVYRLVEIPAQSYGKRLQGRIHRNVHANN